MKGARRLNKDFHTGPQCEMRLEGGHPQARHFRRVQVYLVSLRQRYPGRSRERLDHPEILKVRQADGRRVRRKSGGGRGEQSQMTITKVGGARISRRGTGRRSGFRN